MAWVSLHVHSQYSILDSTASVHALAQKAAEFGMPALALTDFCNMFGAIDFIKACKEVHIKPIIGCEMMVAPFSRHEKRRVPGYFSGYPIILLAKNHDGYRNLCKISSIGYLEGFYYTPRVDKETLRTYAKGLICLSGPIKSYLSHLIIQKREDELQKELVWYQETYGKDFYFELQRHHMSENHIAIEGLDKESWLLQNYLEYVKNQDAVVSRLLELSQERGICTVATNDIHYIYRTDWKAHEILTNVQSGEPCEILEQDASGNPLGRSPNPKRRVMPTHELYFKSSEEMSALFSDIPTAIEETERIAHLCTLELNFKKRFHPVFLPPHMTNQKVKKTVRLKEVAAYLKNLCNEGIAKRYSKERLASVEEKYPGQDPLTVVKDRLALELEVIISKGMCDYLLIVHDFISWAKKQGIPVGPGRGSGAGSIILYLIGITDIEPLRFNLFFERFINPERISFPDIDVDICMDRRSEVIEYTIKKYGKDRVAQIITFGTMKAKMAIRDVGRVLDVPLSKVNEIAKLVPEDPTTTLQKACDIDPKLHSMEEEDEDTKRILEYARKLEGSIRNTGIHAAGLIVCGDSLTDHIPLCNAKDSDISVTQYSMKPVEAVGMLKIDFLGLKTLTSIQKTVDAIKDISIDWVNLPLDDEATFSLLNQGKTQGIFQLESSGMQELARNLHIDKFEEIIAVGALYRPGPMQMIPSFINRKHGREKIEIDHPLMEDIICETYGIMVYQEQVMQIASRLANYSLGEGDDLRRAMGKKDKKEMAKQRKKFRIGALKNDIDEKKSMEIFDKIEKFASYGFNKSHAAAYGYLSYVTAYLKANYPKEWLSALMTCDVDDIAKVAKHIRECNAMNINILPPDINESGVTFVGTSSGIRFAMSAIKGMGHGVVETIVKEREKNGPFRSLYEFLIRIDTNKVGKKHVEILIEAGGFDFTHWSRQQLLENVKPIFAHASRKQKEEAQGVIDMFSTMDEEHFAPTQPSLKQELSQRERLAKERELLGFYLTGHPIDEYQELLTMLHCYPLHKISTLDAGNIIPTAFIVESVKTKVSAKSQKKFAILEISDTIERFELPIWSNMYEKQEYLLVDNQLLYAILQIEYVEERIKLHCLTLEDLTTIDDTKVQMLRTSFEQIRNREKGEIKIGKEHNLSQKEEVKKFCVTLDADRVTLYGIVQLKRLLCEFPGFSPLKLSFQSEEKIIGTVHVASNRGINWNSTLERKIREFSFIHSFSFET